MARTGLFVPCYIGAMRPSEARDARAVLEALGDEVDVLQGRCCGQPAFNSGFREEARTVGREALRLASRLQAIVVPSSSCTSMVRNQLPNLWEGVRRKAAESRAARFVDLASYVAAHPAWAGLRPRLDGVIAYHDSCHGRRELGTTATLTGLLERIDGLDVRRLAREDECCGFGGTFSAKLPEVSQVIAGWKVEDIVATGARAVVSADTSCLAHIQSRALQNGHGIEAWSLAGLLKRALA